MLDLLKKFAVQQLGSNGTNQIGGGHAGVSFLNLFLLSLFFFLIKVFLVYWSYNAIGPIMPKAFWLSKSVDTGSKEYIFRPLAFGEAVVLTILIQSLFR